MSYEEITVKQFKLSSGEDIVAYVQGVEEEGFVLERPVTVSYDREKTGYWFTNWMNMCDFKQPLFLSHSSVITFAECTDTVKEYYIKTVTADSQASPEVNDNFGDEYEYDYEPDPTIIH